jgi:hypothetical protein
MIYYIQWQRSSDKAIEGEPRMCKNQQILKQELESWYQMMRDVRKEFNTDSIVQVSCPFSVIGLRDFSKPVRMFHVIAGKDSEYVLVSTSSDF